MVRQSSFPILYVFGRGDLTVPFYGAKVYPADIEDIVSGDPIANGTYTLKLTGTDRAGNSATATVDITVPAHRPGGSASGTRMHARAGRDL